MVNDEGRQKRKEKRKMIRKAFVGKSIKTEERKMEK